MGLLDWIFGRKSESRPAGPASGGLPVAELARRLGLAEAQLRATPVRYRQFTVPKRAGGARTLHAPEAPLKDVQRRILRKLLKRLRVHEAVHGFEPGRSIVTNARGHALAAVVVRLDLCNFFASTPAARVREYFARLGWGGEAADLLTGLCTHRDGLPQGAPTSPRLSNLVNWPLDSRLAGLADYLGAHYTRYADDLTFSFEKDDRAVGQLVSLAAVIVRECGYELHMKKKLTIRRAHQQQKVTGLVVNDRVALPRRTRRWLRAVDHHTRTGRRATLSPTQREGWAAFERMVETQREE